jgi:predicted DNA-binding protein
MVKVDTSIKLRLETVERLKAIAHPGQSLDGIIRELLNWKEKKGECSDSRSGK